MGEIEGKGLSSIWALACQESSHDGIAGAGGFSLKGALVFMPTFAIAQFQRFFDCGRAIRCLLPFGGGRFFESSCVVWVQRELTLMLSS